jgi:hypothetical protein
MDLDPDPAIFVIDQVQKKSQNSRNQGFSYYFCLMIEGSGAGSGSSIPLTNGSVSGRPKKMWIPWIRIRNRNTGLVQCFTSLCSACSWACHISSPASTATGKSAQTSRRPPLSSSFSFFYLRLVIHPSEVSASFGASF